MTLFEDMAMNMVPSSHMHRHTLETQRKYWVWARSNQTCLWCLRRYPEQPLPCGHTICDTCTEIFGEGTLHLDYEYNIRLCILCGGTRCLTVRLKPPTAAARVLSIDGGGPRCVIPLQNLEILQEFIGPDLSVGEMFELKVGTSSGGLVVLGLDILHLTVPQCQSLFQELARKIFDPTRRRRLLSILLADEVYDTAVFEDTLKEYFGASRRILDVQPSLLSTGKVAVTATSINDGSLYIFTNYNGTAPHRAESGTTVSPINGQKGLLTPPSLRKTTT